MGSPPRPTARMVGAPAFVAGWALVLRALEANAFATTVVRHQEDRGHEVVETGVHGVVRHPMYAGLVAVVLGVSLWMGSSLGLAAAVLPIGLLVVRIRLEEAVLRAALADYESYTR